MKMRELVSFFMLFSLAVSAMLYKDIKTERNIEQAQKQEVVKVN